MSMQANDWRNTRTTPPPEWAKHHGCITAWPAHAYAWGDDLKAAQQEFAAFLRAFCRHAQERLYLLCPGGTLPPMVADLAGSAHPVRVPYGDVWLRDTAPVFLGPGQTVRFQFNGWGGKYRYPHDIELAEALAHELGVACDPIPLVGEGGALESDGKGTWLTTRACLLNDNRNPGRDEEAVQQILADTLGARHVIWLDEGLAGDHTDGHIDNLARFVGPAAVVCGAAQAGDPNQAVLATIESRLRESQDAEGQSLVVHPLPTPGAVLDSEGKPFPASYLNFYIANGAVFVPAYGVPQDSAAREMLQALFPERLVVSVASRAILTGGGSIHCVTQQMPA